MKTLSVFLIAVSIFTSINAQDSTSNKIAVLPFISNEIDLASVQTAESILRMELSNESTMIVISEKKLLRRLAMMTVVMKTVQKKSGKS